MYYEHIQQALDKVQATLSKEELEELLQENQSHLCAKFRPKFSNWFQDTLDTMDSDTLEAVSSVVDNLWIYILHQFVDSLDNINLNNIYEYYGVYHIPAQAYVNSYGYQYSIGCVQHYSCDSLDEATKQANDIVNAGIFKAKDLVIHKLNIGVSQVINISPNREIDYE